MRFLLSITCLAVVFSLMAQTQSTDDWRLETAHHSTEIFLESAGKLLKKAKAGDVDAMSKLGALIESQVQPPQSLVVAWWDAAAHRGDEQAMLRLVRYFLEDGKGTHRNLSAAYAWLRVASAEEVTFTWGCKEVTHDEKWFSETMTPREMEFGRHLEERILEEVRKK